MSIKEKIKLAFEIFFGVLLTVITGGAYLVYRSRNNRTHNGGVQRNNDSIDNGRELTKASKESNREAQQHTRSAGRNIDSALESVGTARGILERARKRSEK